MTIKKEEDDWRYEMIKDFGNEVLQSLENESFPIGLRFLETPTGEFWMILIAGNKDKE